MSVTDNARKELEALQKWAMETIRRAPDQWLNDLWVASFRLTEAEAALARAGKALDAYLAWVNGRQEV